MKITPRGETAEVVCSVLVENGKSISEQLYIFNIFQTVVLSEMYCFDLAYISFLFILLLLFVFGHFPANLSIIFSVKLSSLHSLGSPSDCSCSSQHLRTP